MVASRACQKDNRPAVSAHKPASREKMSSEPASDTVAKEVDTYFLVKI